MAKVVTPPSTGGVVPLSANVTVGRAATLMVTLPDVAEPWLAVTVAAWLVVRVVLAAPPESESTTGLLKVPALVMKVTGTPESGFPDASNTTAVSVLDPPAGGTVVGLAV